MRVTIKTVLEKVDLANTRIGVLDKSVEVAEHSERIERQHRKNAEEEVLRLRLLASEMRGFIMAHHSREDPEGGVMLYREPYTGGENNEVQMPALKYPFMDVRI